ncbi:OmpA family protein [Vibrio sp.]|uniref:OmpA family protein n=1 Tax=Vibrio sp. TaxID=678 RepID=UPI00311F53D0
MIVHTDLSLSESEELEISEQRAESVAKYLVTSGIDRNQIILLARGNLYPVESSDSEEGRVANNRIEFLIEKDK